MKLSELFEADSEDQSTLPPEAAEQLKKEITALAKDTEQKWNNALQLVHQAYDNCDVERPTPAMREAWSEYEQFITLAVQMLGKYCPNQDWKLVTASNPETPPATASVF